MSTNYEAVRDFLLSQCQTSCASGTPQALTPSAWQCFFQSSCRQVFEHDACHAQAYYHCS